MILTPDEINRLYRDPKGLNLFSDERVHQDSCNPSRLCEIVERFTKFYEEDEPEYGCTFCGENSPMTTTTFITCTTTTFPIATISPLGNSGVGMSQTMQAIVDNPGACGLGVFVRSRTRGGLKEYCEYDTAEGRHRPAARTSQDGQGRPHLRAEQASIGHGCSRRRQSYAGICWTVLSPRQLLAHAKVGCGGAGSRGRVLGARCRSGALRLQGDDRFTLRPVRWASSAKQLSPLRGASDAGDRGAFRRLRETLPAHRLTP